MSIFRISALAGMMWAALPAEANACANLLPEAAAQRRALQLQFLQRYSDIIVYGRWSETRGSEAGGRESREGVVTAAERGGERRYQVIFTGEINCGFPAFPENGATGLFYLRDSNPLFSSEENEADDAIYDILHFQDSRSRD